MLVLKFINFFAAFLREFESLGLEILEMIIEGG